MEEQGRLIGLAHDTGKCSIPFQERLKGGRIVDHSTAGAYECAKMDAFWAACCVAGHHGGLPDFGNISNDSADDPTLFGRLKKANEKQIPPYEVPVSLPDAPAPPGFGESLLTDSFIIRMLYSCLVDADFLDTEDFMSEEPVLCDSGEPLSKLLDRLERHIAPWRQPVGELNKKRCEILQACIDGSAQAKGLYTLTVPTGGGKTIASMAFALHHAVRHGMDRVIYVIPYTSIIEQTAAVFRSIFGERNVVEHHSNALFEVAEGSSSGQYGNIKATENWDAPIIVTTSVQFFESLYANRPSKCRKLHSIANSVIIFDEAQMLPSAHLLPCVAAISLFVKSFGATAVLCTATQPSLNDLFSKYAPGIEPKELCPNTPALYESFRRVVFEDIGSMDTDTLSARLAALPQVLCIVNSRKSAQEIFGKLPKEGSYHLSTLMYPAHRRAVLSEIRFRLREGLPCRVVSTSLIEAGVDVDFPAVYREMTGLDSILQAAGRCNREGKRKPEESIVTVFDGVSATPPLLRVNIGAAKESLRDGADPSAPETMTRYFNAYRSLAGNLDKAEVIRAFEHGVQGRMLPFRTVAERFRLIDDASKTVYIPLGEGAALVQRLRNGERTRALFRKLGQYSVNIYDWHFQELMKRGAIVPLEEDSAVLTDLHLYIADMGLVSAGDTGTGLFL
jgi:CRISPR-associated endonuclease/helicase Cas3